MPEGTALAFDFGMRRIGVATGTAFTGTGRALTTIDAESRDARFAAIAELIRDWQPDLLVVGLPLAPDGSSHEMTERCRRFARQLEGRFGLPVHLVDERYTSLEAEESLKETLVDWRQRKAHLDAEAAALILTDYFSQQDRHAA